MTDVLNQADMKDKMAKLGLKPMPTTPKQTADFQAKQIEQWEKAVKISGISID